MDDHGIASARGDPRGGEVLRVMSWNTGHGRDTSMEAVEFVIRLARPDVVLLQETHAEQADAMAPRLGMFAPGGTVSKSALFATPEVGSISSKNLTGGRWPRSVDVYTYRGLVIANAHLDVRPEDRHRQAREVLQVLDGDHPAILGGDLNDTPESEVLELFRDAGWIDLTGDTPTFPTHEPDRKLDYIMGTRSWPRLSWVFDNPMSDHLPVLVDLHFSH